MAAPGTPAATRAAALMNELLPELRRLCELAPLYGRVGLAATLRNGRITSIDLETTLKRQVEEEARR
jgi:hypothetical protein